VGERFAQTKRFFGHRRYRHRERAKRLGGQMLQGMGKGIPRGNLYS
jgi:hypothetical protein